MIKVKKLRITIMLEEEVFTKLRVLQSERITKTKVNCSFSKMVELVLIEGLKHLPKKKKKTKDVTLEK